MIDRLEEGFSRVRESEQRMRRFLADASHELRTPLTALRGTSQVLLRHGDRGGPDTRAALRDIHEEAVRLSRLVDDLLTLNRLDAQEPLQPERVPLLEFMEQFVDRYTGAWPDRTLELDRRAFGRASVAVDQEALRRMLLNLVDNAAKYSSASSPITLTAVPDGDVVAIQVRDDGPGLSTQDAGRAFDRFYRGSESRSRRVGGSGLGLAIVQALVERSGGRVSLDTEPGRGTTVSIALPIDNAVTHQRPR